MTHPRLCLAVCLALLFTPRFAPLSASDDPLASWNDSDSKHAITAFVKKVTTEGTADFLPPERRVAVFDNDGTLWSEQPMYVQAAFALDRVKTLADEHPEWKTTQPFQSVLEGNFAGLALMGEKGALQIVAATHTGMTSDEFSRIVTKWLAEARHPKLNRPYTECVYQPMLEVLKYLRANGFRTYIVSGGGIEFLRTFAEKAYGISPDMVIGSTIKTRYEVRDGQPIINRLPELNFLCDGAGKPVAIQQSIGEMPVLAFGNSDGDFEMLEYTTQGKGPRMAVIIHHTDAERESAYDRLSVVGRLDRGLKEAPARGWTLVNMKHDWRQIFPFSHKP